MLDRVYTTIFPPAEGSLKQCRLKRDYPLTTQKRANMFVLSRIVDTWTHQLQLLVPQEEHTACEREKTKDDLEHFTT